MSTDTHTDLLVTATEDAIILSGPYCPNTINSSSLMTEVDQNFCTAAGGTDRLDMLDL